MNRRLDQVGRVVQALRTAKAIRGWLPRRRRGEGAVRCPAGLHLPCPRVGEQNMDIAKRTKWAQTVDGAREVLAGAQGISQTLENSTLDVCTLAPSEWWIESIQAFLQSQTQPMTLLDVLPSMGSAGCNRLLDKLWGGTPRPSTM